MNLCGTHGAIRANVDGLYLAHAQEITPDFLAELHSERMAKAALRHATYNRAASVPQLVWEIWEREGRDPINASAHQIVNWLERDSMQAFISTPHRV